MVKDTDLLCFCAHMTTISRRNDGNTRHWDGMGRGEMEGWSVFP